MSKKGKEKIKIDFVCERCGKKQEPDKKKVNRRMVIF